MIKYNAALRLALYGGKRQVLDGSNVGTTMKVLVIKSKVSPPDGRIEIFQPRSGMVKWTSGLLPLLVQYGHIDKKPGGWYIYGEEKFQSTENDQHSGFDRFIESNDRLRNAVLRLNYIEGKLDYGEEEHP